MRKTFVDLFCGIGGFHQAASALGLQCVFACDIDAAARHAYEHNYGMSPCGDLSALSASVVPAHHFLFAGFPCQPFSIIGSRRGADDPRGGLYREILRVATAHRPPVMVLENVRQLATMHNGEVLADIQRGIQNLGYRVQWKILNAMHFGLPQKRERIIIIATLRDIGAFDWPASPVPMRPLSGLLERRPDPRHFASARIRRKRRAAHQASAKPAIWHENKGGNVSSHPFSCALRAGASYNYLLVDGERRLSPREMLRLQGFPDSFDIVCSDTQTRKQSGNAVPVPMVQAVVDRLLAACA